MSTNRIEVVASDLYLRHTGVDGNSYVAQHRVWDGELLFMTRLQAATKENQQAADKGRPALANVEVIDRDTYLKERA